MTLAWFAIGVLALVLAPASAQATCTDTAAVAATRAEGDMQCPCATAANHGQYVHCVAGVTKAAVASGSLPEDCRSAVVRCAANSTWGKPGFVTCCVTTNSGSRSHRTRSSGDPAKGGHSGACP